MTVGPILFDPTSDPVNTIAWAWSPDNPVRVFTVIVEVYVTKIVGP